MRRNPTTERARKLVHDSRLARGRSFDESALRISAGRGARVSATSVRRGCERIPLIGRPATNGRHEIRPDYFIGTCLSSTESRGLLWPGIRHVIRPSSGGAARDRGEQRERHGLDELDLLAEEFLVAIRPAPRRTSNGSPRRTGTLPPIASARRSPRSRRWSAFRARWPRPPAHERPVVLGDYRIVRGDRTRRNGGVVYEAVHEPLDRRVALKCCRRAGAAGSRAERFRREGARRGRVAPHQHRPRLRRRRARPASPTTRCN